MNPEELNRASFLKRIFVMFLPFIAKPPTSPAPLADIPLLGDGQTLNANWLNSIVERVNELSQKVK